MRLALGLGLALAATSALAQSAGSPTLGNPVAEIPLSSLSATRERPLFSPTRRPPPHPVAEPAAAPPPPAPAAAAALTPNLIGTAIGPSERIAVVAQGGETPARLREGESAWGWTLLSVGARSAVLERSGRVITLALPSADASAAGVTSPAAPTLGAKVDSDPRP